MDLNIAVDCLELLNPLHANSEARFFGFVSGGLFRVGWLLRTTQSNLDFHIQASAFCLEEMISIGRVSVSLTNGRCITYTKNNSNVDLWKAERGSRIVDLISFISREHDGQTYSSTSPIITARQSGVTTLAPSFDRVNLSTGKLAVTSTATGAGTTIAGGSASSLASLLAGFDRIDFALGKL